MNNFKNLLVVIFGLVRTFQQTYPKMSQTFKGYGRVDVIVSTSIADRCPPIKSQRDRTFCRDAFTRPTNAQYRSSIFDTLEASGGANTHVMLYESDTVFNEKRILASIDWAAKVRKKVSRAEFLQRYQRVLMVRPDVEFTKSSPSVDLQRLCASHAGFNIISGDKGRNCFWHGRDWDWGFLACDPGQLFGLHAEFFWTLETTVLD